MSEATGNSTTEFLTQCMEDFGEDEPDSIVMVISTEAGKLMVRTNVAKKTDVIGMLHAAREMVMDDLRT